MSNERFGHLHDTDGFHETGLSYWQLSSRFLSYFPFVPCLLLPSLLIWLYFPLLCFNLYWTTLFCSTLLTCINIWHASCSIYRSMWVCVCVCVAYGLIFLLTCLFRHLYWIESTYLLIYWSKSMDMFGYKSVGVCLCVFSHILFTCSVLLANNRKSINKYRL